VRSLALLHPESLGRIRLVRPGPRRLDPTAGDGGVACAPARVRVAWTVQSLDRRHRRGRHGRARVAGGPARCIHRPRPGGTRLGARFRRAWPHGRPRPDPGVLLARRRQAAGCRDYGHGSQWTGDYDRREPRVARQPRRCPRLCSPMGAQSLLQPAAIEADPAGLRIAPICLQTGEARAVRRGRTAHEAPRHGGSSTARQDWPLQRLLRSLLGWKEFDGRFAGRRLALAGTGAGTGSAA